MCHVDKHALGRHCNRVVRIGWGGGVANIFLCVSLTNV